MYRCLFFPCHCYNMEALNQSQYSIWLYFIFSIWNGFWYLFIFSIGFKQKIYDCMQSGTIYLFKAHFWFDRMTYGTLIFRSLVNKWVKFSACKIINNSHLFILLNIYMFWTKISGQTSTSSWFGTKTILFLTLHSEFNRSDAFLFEIHCVRCSSVCIGDEMNKHVCI